VVNASREPRSGVFTQGMKKEGGGQCRWLSAALLDALRRALPRKGDPKEQGRERRGESSLSSRLTVRKITLFGRADPP